MGSVAIDMSGQRFGRLLVVERSPGRDPKRAAWLCRCDCGEHAVVVGKQLRQGKTRSCGCINGRVDWIGLRSGRLVVIAEAGRNQHGHSMFRCRCDCGAETVVDGGSLRRGASQSCGCRNQELRKARKSALRHGQAAVIGRNRSLTYKVWLSMKARCYKPTTRGYERYGGRGIKVCQRWRDNYEAFLADMGERPSETHSIDRIDPNGNYEPRNCRWATPLEQATTKRLSAPRVAAVLDKYVAEAPDLIARLRRELLG